MLWKVNDFIKYENEIYFFITLSQDYFHAYQEHLEYYEHDNPLFLILLSSFGDVIVNNFSKTTNEEKKEIFEFIELMVIADDEYLSTATATGLIESIVMNAENLDQTYSLFKEILEYCGNSTHKYIEEWSGFQGINLCRTIIVNTISFSNLTNIIQWSGLKTIEEIVKAVLPLLENNQEWTEFKPLFENLEDSANDEKLKETKLPTTLVSTILDNLGMVVFYRANAKIISSLSYEKDENSPRQCKQWSQYIRENGFESVENYRYDDETIIKTSKALIKYGYETVERIYERTQVSLEE